MVAIFLTVCEIFTNLIKWKTLILKMKVNVNEEKKLDLCHSTENVRFHIGEFFRILASWERTFIQTGYTHTHTHRHTHTDTHTHRHTQRDRGDDFGAKSAKQICLKLYELCEDTLDYNISSQQVFSQSLYKKLIKCLIWHYILSTRKLAFLYVKLTC